MIRWHVLRRGLYPHDTPQPRTHGRMVCCSSHKYAQEHPLHAVGGDFLAVHYNLRVALPRDTCRVHVSLFPRAPRVTFDSCGRLGGMYG